MFLEKLLILLQIKNINKIVLFFVFFLISCSNFDFVYKNSETGSELSITEILVTGSSNDIIKKNLSNKFLSKENSVNYRLSVKSQMETKSIVIENDQPASTVEIKYILNYNLSSYEVRKYNYSIRYLLVDLMLLYGNFSEISPQLFSMVFKI